MTEPRRVGFEAYIQQVVTKSLRSGDKSTRITLDIDNPSAELIDMVNRLHRAYKPVGVAIAEQAEKQSRRASVTP